MLKPTRTVRKTCKRYDVPGHAHYLTFSCYRRQPLLTDETACRWLCQALTAAKTKAPFDLWAWVIMPEHVHLLVWPREETPVSQILRLVKLPVARRALVRVREGDRALAAQMRHGYDGSRPLYRFWQRGGGYDRNIWTAAEVHEKIGYIHANPVRRGLADRPGRWHWSSWRAWHGDVQGNDPVRIDRDSVPAL